MSRSALVRLASRMSYGLGTSMLHRHKVICLRNSKLPSQHSPALTRRLKPEVAQVNARQRGVSECEHGDEHCCP